VNIEIICYDVETGRHTPRWTPSQIEDAVLHGKNLECPFYREKGSEFSKLCQCKLTQAIHLCSGYIVLNIHGTGHPCEEGKQELKRLDTPPKETLADTILAGFTNPSLHTARTGTRMRNGTLGRRGR
jgi:hypothetical protein